MSDLRHRTEALLASAAAVDLVDVWRRLTRIRASLVRQGKLVRRLVKAVLYHDARLRAIEKRLREK